MKKLTTIGFVLMFATFMFSCGGGDTPKDVAETFLTALAEQDYDTAKKHGTKSTAQMLSMIESMAKMASDEDIEKGDMEEITWGETEIDGDTVAVVRYTTPNGEEKMDLKKVDGDWKVDMKKEM